MSRTARLKDSRRNIIYHLRSGFLDLSKNKTALSSVEAKDKMIELFDYYSKIYFCKIYSYIVFDDHYHLIVEMEKKKTLSKKVVNEKTLLLNSKSANQVKYWNQETFARYEHHLFDVASFVASINKTFSKWCTEKIGNKAKGSLREDRYKSVVLADVDAVKETMLYIDSNTLSCGKVASPASYQWSALSKRLSGDLGGLLSLKLIFKKSTEQLALDQYCAFLSNRAGLKSSMQKKAKVVKLAKKDMKEEGVYASEIKYFSNSLIIGSEDSVLFEQKRFASILKKYGKHNDKPKKRQVGFYTL